MLVTDANGCSKSDSILIGAGQTISLGMNATSVTCYGYTDGTASATFNGETSPLSLINGQLELLHPLFLVYMQQHTELLLQMQIVAH